MILMMTTTMMMMMMMMMKRPLCSRLWNMKLSVDCRPAAATEEHNFKSFNKLFSFWSNPCFLFCHKIPQTPACFCPHLTFLYPAFWLLITVSQYLLFHLLPHISYSTKLLCEVPFRNTARLSSVLCSPSRIELASTRSRLFITFISFRPN